MKKKRIKLCLLSLSILLCGCAERMPDNEKPTEKTESQNKLETRDFKTVFTEASEQAEEIKKITEKNMKFNDDFYLNIPEADGVKKVVSFVMKTDEFWDFEKTYQTFEERLQQFFPDVYTEEEKKKNCIVLTHSTVEKDDESGGLLAYRESYEKSKNAILEGKRRLDCIFLEDDKGALEVYPGKFFQMSREVAAKEDNDDAKLMYYPYLNHPIEKWIPITYQYKGEEAYPLMDKEISVKDASKYVEKTLEDIYEDDYALKPAVSSVRVVNMEKGFFDYTFSVTAQYEGIRFDCDPMKYAEYSSQANTGADGEDYDEHPATIQMIKSNEIDSMLGYGENYNFTEKEQYDKIIDLKNAVKIFKNNVSEKMQLEISNIDFAYSVYSKDEDETIQYGTPEWKISAKNKKDNLDYFFYVNAIDGKFHYYYNQSSADKN